jgi:uncharacterized membrane protein
LSPRDALGAGDTGVPDQPILTTVQAGFFIAQSWVGPLPHPRDWASYPADLREVIKVEYQRDKEHQREMMVRAAHAADRDGGRQTLGLWLGFAVVLVLAAVSLVMVLSGHETAGALIGVGDIGVLVGIFVYGARGQQPPGNSARE